MRGFRAFGSAQHPIALSAALVLLFPISIYLVQRSGQRRWWLAAGLLFAGSLATMSRTSVIMLVVVGLVFVLLRPREVKRLLPALIPGLALVHFALPGTLITLKQSFFPTGGLLAQQQANAGYSGQGRLADVGPALDSWSQNPLFGGGYGTRIVGCGRDRRPDPGRPVARDAPRDRPAGSRRLALARVLVYQPLRPSRTGGPIIARLAHDGGHCHPRLLSQSGCSSSTLSPSSRSRCSSSC